jgi:hypothetical protein
MKPSYTPRIARREQQFDANVVVVQKRLLAFGEMQKQPGKTLKNGTPIHLLFIHLAGHPAFEFNDQGNTRCSHHVDSVELTDTSLRVIYAKGAGPMSGRVSLTKKLEIFDDDHEPQQLRSVRVNFKATKKQLAAMQKALATLEDAPEEHEPPAKRKPRAR